MLNPLSFTTLGAEPFFWFGGETARGEGEDLRKVYSGIHFVLRVEFPQKRDCSHDGIVGQ